MQDWIYMIDDSMVYCHMASESIAHEAEAEWAIDSELIRARGIIVNYTMLSKRVCSKLNTSWKSVVFTNKVGKNSRYCFVGVLDKTIILLALVGYEMIIAISALRDLVG